MNRRSFLAAMPLFGWLATKREQPRVVAIRMNLKPIYSYRDGKAVGLSGFSGLSGPPAAACCITPATASPAP